MFKDALKTALKEKGMTAAELSRLTGIGRSSLSQYLSGKFVPGPERQTVIAEALGLRPDFFAEAREDGPEPLNNLPVKTAAKLMGKSKEFVYQGLRDRVFPWGYAVKMGREWSYYISPVAFTRHTGLKTT